MTRHPTSCSAPFAAQLTLAIVCLAPLTVVADETEPPQAAEATAEKTPATDRPKDEAPAPEEADELDRRVKHVTTKMQQAQTKLLEKDTGAATQELQKAIIAGLDELLKTPPQPNKSNSGGGGGGGSSNSSSSSGKGKSSNSQPSGTSQSQSSPGKQPAGEEPMPGGEQSGNEQERQNAEDSEERTGEAKTSKAAPLPRRRMEVDVWGHLPDKVREKLLSAYGERMVPQYEDLVQRFYRSLADSATRSDSSVPPVRSDR